MHEMGVASSILEAANKELDRYPGHRVDRIGVRIGEFAGVDPDSLNFCFEVLTGGTVKLEIQWRQDSDDLDLAYLDLDESEAGSEPAGRLAGGREVAA